MGFELMAAATETEPAVGIGVFADEALIDAARRRRRRDPNAREGLAALLTSGSFLAAAVPLAVLTSSSRPYHPVTAILLCLGLGILSRFELEHGSGSAVPTQLLFVPMLFLLPLGVVPLLVCAGFLVGGGIDFVQGKLRAQRAGVLIGCAWFSLPAALVLQMDGEKAASWSHWPIYLAALAAQFAGDFVHTVVHERLAHQVAARALIGPVSRVYVFDALLSPVAFLSALAAVRGDLGFLALLPLVAVFSSLARERAGRLDAALDAARHATLARTDTLTGIANRLAWNERLEELIGTEGVAPVAVCIIDLDRFKMYNDGHGHAAGDALLAETAARWRTELRPGDVLARLGGEEFGLALPNAGASAAQDVIERLRASIPDRQTCSAGVAFHEPGESIGAVMRRADNALYLAKQGGRNRTVVAPAAADDPLGPPEAPIYGALANTV